MNTAPLSGFLNLRKPPGPTSNDMIEEMRGILGANCGHAGTLDPKAEGVLVLGVGPMRKFIQFMDHQKAYEGVVLLGRESTTLDMEGELTPPQKVSCSPEEAAAAGKSLIGTLELPVPAYSAVHVDGQRSYQLAREGKTVEQPLRKCTVESLGIISVELPRVRFSVVCSGGTYIRALAAEWGRLLGCGGLLETLVRTRSGPFPIESSFSPETVRRETGLGRTGELLVSPENALAPLPVCGFEGDAARLLRYGRPAPLPPFGTPTPAGPGTQRSSTPVRLEPGSHFIIMTRDGGFLGVGRAVPDPGNPGGLLAMPERLIPEPQP